MRLKILGAVFVTAAMVLAGCSGSSDSSTSTSGGTTTASGSTGTHSTSGSSGAASTTATTSANNSTSATVGSNTTGTNVTTTGSSGTTATNVGNSTGSTGATTQGNSTGTSGTTSCGGATCAAGQSCGTFSTSHGNVTACACAPPQTNQAGAVVAPDTCAGNQDGNIVCDQFTLACRGPRTYEHPNTAGVYPDGGGPNTSCDANNDYDTVTFCNTTIDPVSGDCAPLDDGGPGDEPLCVEFCITGADCINAGTFCRAPAFTNSLDGGDFYIDLPDGGSAPLGFCDVNLCGPVAGEDGGELNGDYFATCDAHGTGDGTCLPVLINELGLCTVDDSSATLGQACDPDTFAGDSTFACPPDDLCFGNGTAPSDTGHCTPMCNSHATPGGPYNFICPTGLSCSGFSGDLIADGGLNPGVCQ